MACVLLTRPLEASQRVADNLDAHGFESLICPLITIKKTDYSFPQIDAFDVLLVTSANALHILTQETDIRHIPVWTVGDHSAAVAREYGFTSVRSFSGTVQDMFAAAKAQPTFSYLYLSGRHKAFMLKNRLLREGIECAEHIIYEAVLERHMPLKLGTALDKGRIDYALFYSRRTAEAFMNLMQQENRTEALKRIKALCFSDSVLQSIQSDYWARTHVCAHPDHAHMIDLLLDISNNQNN